MNAQAQAVTPATPAKELKLSQELEILKPEIMKVLPPHVTPDKFMRVVLTAISQNPDLYRADRRSLFTACVKAAQDGLLPDGREAALVIFNTKEKFTDEHDKKQERWIKKVQYMPMVYGILKKVRNSGELLSIVANVVFEQDTFRYWVDDVGEHVTHEPNVLAPDRGKLIAGYAIAKTKDGGIYIEVMSRGQIEQVRAVSKAKDDGPWVAWYDEMARKTIIRRLSKRLPMSTDIERVIRRDDEMYDLSRQATTTARSGVDAAKALLGLSSTEVDEETGEVIDGDPPPEDYVPHYTEATALEQIAKASTIPQLDMVQELVRNDFDKSNRKLPVAIDAAFNDRREALQQAQQKL